MKAIYKILTGAFALATMVGCYEDFDMPEAFPRYDTDEAFESAFAGEGLTLVSIKNVKDHFRTTFMGLSNEYHDGLSYSGENDNWKDTKTIKFGELTAIEASTRTGDEAIVEWKEAADYYIKGRVISDDTLGNVYKSMFIDDGTAAIEIKLTNGIYLNYPQGSWVYVKLRDLYLGNYRMMLSIGLGPTSSFNAIGTEKYYANSNIEDQKTINEHVFLGKKDDSTPLYAKVVDKNSYNTLTFDDLGRLICFKGLRCYYSDTTTQRGDKNPSIILSGGYNDANIFPQWIDTNYKPKMPTTKPWYKWAFSYNGVSLYGSVCFTYHYDELMNGRSFTTNDAGVYVVRSSGYSRFAGRPVPRDGAEADITAIYGVYGKSQYNMTFQLTVNKFEDMVFAAGESAFLTDGTKDTNRDGKIDEHDSNEVLWLTPDGYSYNEETGEYEYDSENDSYFVPSKESSDRSE